LKPFSHHSIGSSDAFWKFSACKIYNDVLGAVSQFLRLKAKLFAMKFRCIFCVIHLQSLQKCFGRIFSIFSIFACKNEALCSEVQTHLEVFTLKVQKKSSGRIFKIFASKNEGISRHVQTHFGSSLPASFTEKVLGAIPRFVRPKTKLFAVKFRRILEVLCLTRFMKKVDASSRFFVQK